MTFILNNFYVCLAADLTLLGFCLHFADLLWWLAYFYPDRADLLVSEVGGHWWCVTFVLLHFGCFIRRLLRPQHFLGLIRLSSHVNLNTLQLQLLLVSCVSGTIGLDIEIWRFVGESGRGRIHGGLDVRCIVLEGRSTQFLLLNLADLLKDGDLARCATLYWEVIFDTRVLWDLRGNPWYFTLEFWFDHLLL